MTQPQAASPAQVSDPAPATLIAPAEQIFDLPALRDQLFASFPEDASEADIRKLTVACIRQAQKDGRDAIARAFAETPFGARRTTRAYTWLTDGMIRLTFEPNESWYLH